MTTELPIPYPSAPDHFPKLTVAELVAHCRVSARKSGFRSNFEGVGGIGRGVLVASMRGEFLCL